MTRQLGIVRHARRTARAIANPLGLPEELVLGGTLVAIIVGGAYLWRKYAGGSSTVTWTEITSAPTFQAGKTYRVTMDPIPGATIEDAASGFDQFSDPAKGGGVLKDNPPFNASWLDQDTNRWHLDFIATENATPTNLPAGTRIWVVA